MYPWIWQILPGPKPLRVLIAVLLVFVVLAVLVLYVFPWAVDTIPFLDVTVEE